MVWSPTQALGALKSLSQGMPLLACLEVSVYMQAIYQLPRTVFRYAVGAAPQCDHGQKEDKSFESALR